MEVPLFPGIFWYQFIVQQAYYFLLSGGYLCSYFDQLTSTLLNQTDRILGGFNMSLGQTWTGMGLYWPPYISSYAFT